MMKLSGSVSHKAYLSVCLLCLSGMAAPLTAATDVQSVNVVQQSVKKVYGKVIDTGGAPVIGANVTQKGTTNGTITDIDGNFTLEVPKGASIIVSYIGYNVQELMVTSNTQYEVVLKEDTQNLEEVVVVGYGTQKR